MARDVRLNIATPIRSIEVLDAKKIEDASRTKIVAAEVERARQCLMQLCAALEKGVVELETCRRTLFSSHREQIVRLSLEIAGKILAKEIAEGRYAIEKIVAEALQSAPPARQTTLRLNPEDVKTFQKAAAEQGLTLPPNTDITADWAVNPAECIIESELGVVDSLIDEHLRRIGEALLEMEQPV